MDIWNKNAMNNTLKTCAKHVRRSSSERWNTRYEPFANAAAASPKYATGSNLCPSTLSFHVWNKYSPTVLTDLVEMPIPLRWKCRSASVWPKTVMAYPSLTSLYVKKESIIAARPIPSQIIQLLLLFIMLQLMKSYRLKKLQLNN